MLKLSRQQQQRRNAFNRTSKGNTCIGDPDARDYSTGQESTFQPASGDSNSGRFGKIDGGPEFKTPQWLRTVKSS